MPAPQPRMHGLSHVRGGPDPIPGLLPPPSGPGLSGLILATPDLAGFWPLNESDGDIAHDISGNGWDMTSGSNDPPIWAQPAGPPGDQTAKFDANQAVANTSFGTLSGDLTLEIWASRGETIHNQWLIGQGNSPVVNQSGIALFVGSSTTGTHNKLTAYIGDSSGGPHTIESDATIAVDVWHHCAVVRNSNVWTMYLDGVAQAATYNDGGTNYAAAPGIWIGVFSGGTPEPVALLSYAAAYSRALSAGELASRYITATAGSGDAGKVLTADDTAGSSWEWGTLRVDGTRYEEILTGANLTSTDNTDGTVTLDAAAGGGGDPADDTAVWMPLVDSDGTCVLDGDGAVIPTLIPL